MDKADDEKFWSFSIDFYGRDGVQDACLELQDRHDGDVNLILFLLWQALQSMEFDRAAIAGLDRSLSPWRQGVVEPLRSIRRHMKDLDTDLRPADVEDLRNSVKELELKSEFLAQRLLVAKKDAGRKSRQSKEIIAYRNLQAYGDFLGRLLPRDLCDLLIGNLS